MQRSQTGLLNGTRDMDAHMSLALPTNRERATDRLAIGPEDVRKRRQARVRARRVQRLAASETAEEREIRLCEGERNRRASESEEAREHRLVRDRGSAALRRQPKSGRHVLRDAVLRIGHSMQLEHHRQGRHASSSRRLQDMQEVRVVETPEEREARLLQLRPSG